MVDTLMDVESLKQAAVPAKPERPRFRRELGLVALPTAITVARIFVNDTLRQWDALFIEDHIARLAVELVELSIRDTGPTDERPTGRIRLQMLGYERHIVFEVTDSAKELLVLDLAHTVPEGEGLGLIDAVADRWGSFMAPRGRVNWAEIAVYGRTKAGLPVRDPRPPAWSPPPSDEPAETPGDDFLRRVYDRLKEL
ncbi:ATP-binding protein [Lentzea sp. NPDC051838]|uniref:ATP-binding protein n=1 Tax=Lentzea sp. NPDC051838 TaxID=3154849 RepID=UPI003426949A